MFKSRIEVATYVALSFIGKPYYWGGDDPVQGFDCSGFVVEILKSCGVLPLEGDWTADDLFWLFDKNKLNFPWSFNAFPTEGCLIYFRSPHVEKITHVEYCLSEDVSIGASGGGSKTTSLEEAIKKNAYIKIRPFRNKKPVLAFSNPFYKKPV